MKIWNLFLGPGGEELLMGPRRESACVSSTGLICRCCQDVPNRNNCQDEKICAAFRLFRVQIFHSAARHFGRVRSSSTLQRGSRRIRPESSTVEGLSGLETCVNERNRDISTIEFQNC
jgi:hypothetical protein